MTLAPGGARTPLVCVHGAAGHLRVFEGLADRLAPERPVWGLRMVADDPAGAEPCGRIDVLAARYVLALRDAYPAGPFLILGECNGGPLAYEMAQQLAAHGQETLLLLVDSWAPGWPRLRSGVPSQAYHRLDATRMLVHHMRTAARLPAAERREYLAARASRAWAKLVQRRGAAQGRPSEERLRVSAFRRALAAYDPNPYPGPIVVFRGSALPWGATPSRDLGWGGLADQRTVIEIPGYLGSTLLKGSVELLADEVRRAIGRFGDRAAAVTATPVGTML